MELPDVLAGPLLRKCSANEVFIWVAFSKPFDLELEVYDAQLIPSVASCIKGRSPSAVGASYASAAAVTDPNVTYVRAAKNLHVYLLRATPFKRQFPLDVTLAYEVYAIEPSPPVPPGGSASAQTKVSSRRSGLCEHLRKDESQHSSRPRGIAPLYQRGYTDDPTAKGATPAAQPVYRFGADLRPNPLIRFSYEEPKARKTYHFELPTFVLQGKGELRAWATSCMKPHAEPQSAASLMYDESAPRPDSAGQLPIGAYNVKQRPHCLLLMGDQIYADDVSFLLFTGVRHLRTLLMGEDEFAPLSGNPSVDKLDPDTRHKYVAENNPYSPLSLDRNVQNQLFSFGEYAAYYLMHLNPALWPDLKTAEFDAEKLMVALKSWTPDERSRRLSIEFDRLTRNLPALYAFATVLANVPTYCICDDHEVTDDWFMDRDWIEFRPNAKAKKGTPSEDTSTPSRIAQYIVAGAVHAYAIFQGLGNDPLTVSRTLSGLEAPPTHKTYVDVLRRLLDSRWSFATPTTPPIVFLDTRTKRRGTGTSDYALALGSIDYTESPARPFPIVRRLTQMLMTEPSAIPQAVSGHAHANGRLLLVTPSPVLSSDGIEWRAKNFPFRRDPRVLDDELWRSNLSNYFMLVKELTNAGVRHVSVISGDLHYGYRRTASLTECIGAIRKPLLQVDQIVSSPLLNPFERRYGGGKSWLLQIAQQYFQEDYAMTRRFSRTLDQQELPQNAWRIDHTNQASELIAKRSIEEQIRPATCMQANGTSTKGMITSNHFIELFISTDDIKVLYHVQDAR